MTIAQPPARLGQLTAGVNETLSPSDTRERASNKVAHERRGPKLLTESTAGLAKEAPGKLARHLFEAECQSLKSLV